jgi:hypothetical protein|uniref:Tail assembly chaperone n=2 Tax=unclassified Caudoviricetes TaxID=2788787 RepID=A0A8S5MNY5_9CAUD|nr:MAG TPA: tail assembly chaperone [Myoviridae sp. ctUFx54]DAE01767.1 MAG TPA: tail assembly chaperone [Myoviridae sp. ctLRE27]
MAMNINFDDGIEEITINNDKNRVLRVNVRDIGILDRVQHVADNFQNQIKTLGEELTITSDGEAAVPEIAEAVRRINQEMRTEFDSIFYEGASEIVFGKQNPLSMSNGNTIFNNFMTAFAEYIKPFIEKETKKMQKNIEKYRKAYKKK